MKAVRRTCSDDGADVPPAQTGPADSRPRDVRPVDHLVNAVVGDSDHHAVLRQEETVSKSLLSEGTEDSCLLPRGRQEVETTDDVTPANISKAKHATC